MYIYKRTEFHPYELYTVGSYDSGEWDTESDHNTAQDAAQRTHYLNGGTDENLILINAELLEALKKVRGDINWMLNEQKFLNGFVFEYLDKAIAKAEGK